MRKMLIRPGSLSIKIYAEMKWYAVCLAGIINCRTVDQNEIKNTQFYIFNDILVCSLFERS